jgi:hypothetical protein
VTTEADLIRRALDCIEQAEMVLRDTRQTHVAGQWLIISDKWLHIYENVDLSVLDDEEVASPPGLLDDEEADDDDYDLDLEDDEDEDDPEANGHRAQDAALKVIGEGWGIIGVPDSPEPPQTD